MAIGNGLISFTQLRRTAEVVREERCCHDDQSEWENTFNRGLLLDIKAISDNDEVKLHLLLAVLEWQRLSMVHLNLAATFDSISEVIEKGGSDIVKKLISANYTEVEFISLVDWLVQQVGALASLAAANFGKDKRNRAIVNHTTKITIGSPAVLLDCLCLMSKEMPAGLSSSYFVVVALDDYLNYLKWNKDTVAYCCRFRAIISTSTKLKHLFHDFDKRRQEQDREEMYREIYSGSNYQRSREGSNNQRRRLVVRRENIIEDSLELLNFNSEDSLLNGIHITFAGEEGEDAGGLTKEWISLLTQQLIGKVFQRGEDGADRMELKPSCSFSDANLMGVVLGLSLLLQIVIDVSLPRFLYRHLLSRSYCCTLDDLKQIRPTFANGLAQIIDWQEAGFSENLSMYFTCTSTLGTTVQLIKDGDITPVTYSNRQMYVERVCQYVVIEQNKAQMDALKSGFDHICQDIPTLQLLSIDEFDSLIRGKEVSISLEFLKRLCKVECQVPNDDYLDQFWDVLAESKNPDILKSLLHFVTANHRVSISSEKDSIAFQIIILQGSEFINRLPTASTCTNTLFLPRYPTKDLLRSRLLIALRQGSVGFGLK